LIKKNENAPKIESKKSAENALRELEYFFRILIQFFELIIFFIQNKKSTKNQRKE
jgi:hypothetical protein